MQSSFKYCIHIFLVIAVLSSCNDEITFNQGAAGNRMVVHAKAEVGKNLRLEIRQSELITEDTLEQPIDGVAIELFVNGLLRESAYTDLAGKALMNYNVTSHDSVRLEFSKPSFEDVYTQSIIPSAVGVLQFDTTNKRPGVQGLRISFYDKPQEKNFYQVSLRGKRWYYTIDPNTGMRTDSMFSSEIIDMKSVNRLFFFG